LPWVRLLYIYPTVLTLRMVDVIAQHEALLPYLDMPLQHADRDVLRSMNRPSDPDMTRRLIDHARNKLPDLTMRTTFIVGYPGETEQQFERLLAFVESEQFDHVGVFTYSPEAGTVAANLGDHVPAQVAEERRERIMEAQQTISLHKNQMMVGSTLQVLIEGTGELENEDGTTGPIAVGRGRRHAPEVDGLVFVPGQLAIGEMAEITITDARPYDLWGVPATEDGRIKRSPIHAVRRHPPSRSRVRRRGRPVPMATPTGT
jgi:ribosomal protein S12 methylthiotransferase